MAITIRNTGSGVLEFRRNEQLLQTARVTTHTRLELNVHDGAEGFLGRVVVAPTDDGDISAFVDGVFVVLPPPGKRVLRRDGRVCVIHVQLRVVNGKPKNWAVQTACGSHLGVFDRDEYATKLRLSGESPTCLACIGNA